MYQQDLDKKLIAEAELRISKTRSALLMKEPFFGLMALRLKLIPSEAVPVMGVTRKALYFNPKVVAQLPKHSLYFIVAHEVMHVVLGHHFRMKDEDQFPDRKMVNEAQDFVINGLLDDEGFAHPDEPWKPLIDQKQFKGWSAEEVYKHIASHPDDFPDMGMGAGSNSSDMGIVMNEPMTQEQMRNEEVLTKQAIAEAKEAAKMQGKLPGTLEEILEEVLEVKINWVAELTRFFKEKIQNGYAWNKPNRRFIQQGIYLPSHATRPTGSVVICVDTSGSLDSAQLADFMGEINGILQFVRPKATHVIQCDAKIHTHETYTIDDYPLDIKMVGRGGTNFNPIFSYIEDGEVERPDALLYFTDLCAQFPEEEPDYPVIWLAHGTKEEAPFGITLHIGDT